MGKNIRLRNLLIRGYVTPRSIVDLISCGNVGVLVFVVKAVKLIVYSKACILKSLFYVNRIERVCSRRRSLTTVCGINACDTKYAYIFLGFCV